MYQVMRVILFALLVTAGLVSCKKRCGSDCKPPDYIPNPKCPANNKIGICIFTKDNCLSDKECPPGCYCCPDGCGKKCTKPECPAIDCPDVHCENGHKLDKNGCETCECKDSAPLPLGCPTPPSRFLVKCSKVIDTCNSNFDCAGDKICCNNPCGRCCTDPVPIKYGFCPARPDPATVDCASSGDNCHLDSECPDSQKCCFTACGNVCLAPIATPADNPGVCKYVPPFPPCSDFENERKCEADFECASYEKCCETTCGKFCLESEPLVVNPGECPIPEKGDIFCPYYHKQCNQDGNCPPFQKCCEDNCGTRCTEPVPKLGSCPKTVGLLCALYHGCFNDHQCPGNQLCCNVGYCGGRCVDPDLSGIKPGVCPVLIDPEFTICLTGSKDECKTDLDCPEDDKCCKGPCGSICDLVRPKPGVCPVPTPLSVVLCSLTDSKDECTEDHECPDDLKCCDHPCGKRCDLYRPKPGVCPAPPRLSRALCSIDSKDECTFDYECPKDLKCCDHPCGKRCDLYRPKEGVCPVPTPLSVVLCSLTDSKDECTYDYECSKDLKCCDHPCGKRCDLYRPKEGSCPVTAIPGTSEVCHHPQCDYDYECELNLKCCLTGCGLMCVAPTPGSTDSSSSSSSSSDSESSSSSDSDSDSSGSSNSDSSGSSNSDSSGSSNSDSSGSSNSGSSGSSNSDSSGSSHSDSSGSSHSGYSASSFSGEFLNSFESEFIESAETK